MYSHVACDVMKERTLYLLKLSSLIWHLMPYLFLSNYSLFGFLFSHVPTICTLGGLNISVSYFKTVDASFAQPFFSVSHT